MLTLLKMLAGRIRGMFSRRREDEEFSDEIRAHLEMLAEENMRRGMPLAEARREAKIRLGGSAQLRETHRELTGLPFLETLFQDIRFALRMLRKSPGFTAVVVLTLALGIGANAAVFSLIDAVMLRTLPVDRPDELVQLKRQDPRYAGGGPAAFSILDSFLWSGGASSLFSNPLWEQVRDQQNVFSGVFAWSNHQFDLARGGTIQPADGSFVSGDFFTTLGLFPAAGRLITKSDDYRSCPPVAVLSYGFWQSHYGGASTAVGSILSLDDHPFEIIGVAPPGFYGMDVGRESQVFLPICTVEISRIESLDARSWWWLYVAGRIKPGISRAQLIARLRVFSPRIFTAALPQYEQRSFVKEKLVATSAATGTSITLRQRFDQPLQVLMAIVGLVLLIACANIAGLMLTRGVVREKEIAVRLALGASRWRLIKQLLTECILLSLMGAIVGFLFARLGTVLLIRSFSIHSFYTYGNIPVLLDLSPDGRVLGFTAAVAILTVALFGILPSLRSTGVSLTSAMKGIRTIEFDRPARFRGRSLIVASQVALSLVLLVAAGLLLRSFAKLATLDPGFDRKNVLIVYTQLWPAVPRDRRPATLDQIENRLRALPGVLSASRSSETPAETGYGQHDVHTEWSKGFTDAQSLSMSVNVSHEYFGTLRMQFLEGRNFNSGDTSTSPAVAIIDQTAARRFFPGLDPVGKTFWIDGVPGRTGPPIEVVGVVRNAKYTSLREEIHPTVFFPATQAPDLLVANAFELRTAVRPTALISSVQAAIASVNSGITLEFHTLAQQVSDSMVQERLLAQLSGFFGSLALLLVSIGLYGTVSYLVAQRQREFGIRMALGAEPGSILRLIMRDVFSVVAIGLLAGIAMSLAATRLLQQLLFRIGPRDAVTLVIAVAALLIVALVAAYLPGRRATKINPMEALRHE
ncbi:MAG: ABC transporter permease [Candidatus Acidiferrales bacterium]